MPYHKRAVTLFDDLTPFDTLVTVWIFKVVLQIPFYLTDRPIPTAVVNNFMICIRI